MKKSVLVVLVVVVLLGLTIIADRMWLKGTKPGSVSTNGPMAPDVTLKDLQGHEVSLEQFKGKVVLVNFWATWCAPCRIEIAWLIEFQQKYGAQGFTVLGVAMDDEGKSVVEPYVRDERFDVDGQRMAINYPIVLGDEDIVQKFGGLLGVPTSLVISREGKIVKRFIGLTNHAALMRQIEGLL